MEGLPKVVVYPNPTKGKFQTTNTIPRTRDQANSNSQISIDKLEVVDIYGKISRSFNPYAVTRNPQLDISHLPPGIYFIKMRIDNQVVVKKIIKL
jgi:hypothetical protein